MQKTTQLVAVAAALMRKPDAPHYGYDTAKETGLRSGVLYPILRRLHNEGWLEDGWEDPTTVQGRPPRRYYTLTELGKRELGALAALSPADSEARARRPGAMKPGFAR